MDTFRRLLLAAAAIAILGLPVIAAAGPDEKAQATALFREVMSPFCPGLTLADCPSQQAFDMRRDITARLEKGAPRAGILSELVDRYGVRILADPTPTRQGAVIWGTPLLAAALAGAGLTRFVRRSVAHAGQVPEPSDTTTPALDDRLAEELRELD